jgi:cell wall assembly regulator SMI1
MEINILDEQLSRLRPEFYQNLLSPLQDSEIQELEEKYQLILPEDLKSLYSWKNGQAIGSFDSFVNNSTFLSLQEALEISAELTSMIGYDFENRKLVE